MNFDQIEYFSTARNRVELIILNASQKNIVDLCENDFSEGSSLSLYFQEDVVDVIEDRPIYSIENWSIVQKHSKLQVGAFFLEEDLKGVHITFVLYDRDYWEDLQILVQKMLEHFPLPKFRFKRVLKIKNYVPIENSANPKSVSPSSIYPIKPEETAPREEFFKYYYLNKQNGGPKYTLKDLSEDIAFSYSYTKSLYYAWIDVNEPQ